MPHRRPARPLRAGPSLALAVGLLLGGLLLVGGCADAAYEPDPEAVPFELTTHCGIDELVHEGLWYQRVDGPLDTGGGNPPRGWDNPSQAGWLLVEGDRATFTDDQGHEEVFEVREGATAAIDLCS